MDTDAFTERLREKRRDAVCPHDPRVCQHVYSVPAAPEEPLCKLTEGVCMEPAPREE